MTMFHALTVNKIERAKRTEKQLTDGRALFLKLNWATGVHSWKLDYKSPTRNKRDTLPIGEFDTRASNKAREDNIEWARTEAAKARAQVAAGLDPKDVQKAAAAAAEALRADAALVAAGGPRRGTFEWAARDYYAQCYRSESDIAAGLLSIWGPEHARKWIKTLENHVFPLIGAKLVADIGRDDVRNIVKALDAKRQWESARNVQGYCLQTLEHCIDELKLIKANPVAGMKVIKRLGKKKHFPGVTSVAGLRNVVRTMDAYTFCDVRRHCMLTMLYVAQRPGTVQTMEWAELDLDAGMWVIPAAKMKGDVMDKAEGDDHTVPLSSQCVEVLRARLAACEKDAEGKPVSLYVFSGATRGSRTSPMCRKMMQQVFEQLFKDVQVPHGCRATFRTMARECLGVAVDVLEVHLGHSTGEELGGAYSREEFLDARKKAVQMWADFIDQQRTAQVIEFAKAA